MRSPFASILLTVSALAQTATFHAGTKLVEVDVVARRGAAPATGLTKDDFTVVDNGKPQRIAFFSVRSRSVSGSTPAPLPPGFVSNRLTRAGEPFTHATVFLLDQKNTPYEAQAFAIQRIVKFLKERRTGDRIGIYTFLSDGSVHAVPELTDDPDQLNRAAMNLRPHQPTSQSPDVEGVAGGRAISEWAIIAMKSRMDDSRQALKTIAGHLAGVPGRKSLIWVSTAFPILYPSPPDRDVLNAMPDIDIAARALNDANVAVYPVDPRGLVGALTGMTAIRDAQSGPLPAGLMMQMPPAGNGTLSGSDTLRQMAALTGGQVVYNGNAIEDSFRDAIEDGELTYTLGFYPAQDDRDGLWHKLKVTVDRRGVNLRYRQQYFSSRESDAASDRPALDQLLKQQLDATQLELRAAAAPDPAHPGFLEVRVNVDLHDVELRHENGRHSGEVDVSYHVEGTGEVTTRTFRIDIPDDRFAAFLENGFDATTSLDATHGVEALRVVVQDRATGAAGTVTLPLPQR